MLDRAELAESVAEPERLQSALVACETAIQELDAMDASRPDVSLLRARFWLKKGRLHERSPSRHNTPEWRAQALRAYLRSAADAESAAAKMPTAYPTLALAWVNQAHLHAVAPDTSATAGVLYRRTLDLLANPPPGAAFTEPERALLLGATGLNLGALLLRHRAPTWRTEGEVALIRAIAHLTPLAEHHDAARRNLASAWSHLGLLRAAAQDARSALEAHEQAWGFIAGRGSPLEQASILINLGRAREIAVGTSPTLGGATALREALHLLAPVERHDAHATELGLIARHALCAALARTDAASACNEADHWIQSGLALHAAHPTTPGIAAATDHLHTIALWWRERAGLEPLIDWLERHPPPPDRPQRLRAAREAYDRGRQLAAKLSFELWMGPQGDQHRHLLHRLSAIETKLRELVPAPRPLPPTAR